MVNSIKKQISKANIAYREGNPIMSDSEYDLLLEELYILSPDDDLLNKIGHDIKDISRKSKLPIEMTSMNKVKSIDDLLNWFRLKNIPNGSDLVITPKYDGISLCVNEISGESWTRGNGILGQKSDDHYGMMGNKLTHKHFNFTYGEVMMPKDTFMTKYSKDFANPRNLVAGLLNSKDVSPILSDCKYVKYGAVSTFSDDIKKKSDILNKLNSSQESKVPFSIIMINDINDSYLFDLFKNWSIEFEIDGLILEIDDLSLQNKLGRETSSNNPIWARAFKHPSFEQSATTKVHSISWNISKQGYLKPTLHIDPVSLDGVTVSNVTGNNARFVRDMGIGVGAEVIVKRSGMVIPLIVDVIKRVDFTQPIIEGVDIEWNKSGIELITIGETDDQKLKKIISFFQILESDNVSEGVITQLWDAGYKTIKSILDLKISDLEKIDRFGKRKSKIVYDSIQKSVSGVELSKLQHATGIFNGLGSKKLVLLDHFKSKPSVREVMEIDGFAEISAKTYIDNWDSFHEFIKDLPVRIKEKENKESAKVGNDLEGKSFVFTGIRRKDLVDIIESRGGIESGSVSKNVTHLICKDKSSSSSKMKKATDIGITIMDINDLEEFLKK